MKILNLYSGIGGNRRNWGENHEVTAVELNKEIANIYQDLFPNDNVIIGDAHNYLLKNIFKYDLIWSSPPCPSHSRMRYMLTKTKFGGGADRDIKYVDMLLYQEIILLNKYCKGKYVIENVKPYYEPLIKPTKELSRHLFWANFPIGNYNNKSAKIREGSIQYLQQENGFDLSKYKIKHRKDTILRNCVNSDLGLYILNCANNVITKENPKQLDMFE